MAELAVITPTRERPRQFAELVRAIGTTAHGAVTVLAGVDDDDPSDYESELDRADAGVRVVILRGPRKSLSAWTNELAAVALEAEKPRFLASLGDDHRPRTHGWDRKLIEAIEDLGGNGFAYGNDLFQGPAVPTAWVESADVVRALGWMMLPACEHMYVDNAVYALGTASGRITYRPDVVIEHLHPLAGKADWDASYRDSNSKERYAADKIGYLTWQAEQLATDAAKVAVLNTKPSTGNDPSPCV